MRTQALPQAAFILARDGTLLFGPSESADHQDFEGGTIYDQVRPEQRDFVRQTLAWVFERAEGSAFELHGLGSRHPDSWFQCRIAPNVTRGSVVSATLVATDITAYKERELELEAERDQLRERLAGGQDAAPAPAPGTYPPAPSARAGLLLPPLVEQLGEAVFMVDPEAGRVVDAGDGACAWLRMPREQLLATPIRELRTDIPLLPPESPREMPFTETRLRPRPIVLHGSSRRADGSVFPVQSLLSEVIAGGRRYVMVVVRDAKSGWHTGEQLRDLRTRYQDLFENVGVMVFLMSRSGIVVDANALAVETLGYQRDEIIGVDARRLLVFKPEDAARHHQATGKGESIRDLPSHIRCKDGTKLPCAFSAIPLLTTEGSIKGYQCIVQPAEAPALDVAPAPRVEQRVERPSAAEPEPRPSVPAGAILVVTSDAQLHADVRAALEREGFEVMHGLDAAGARQLISERRYMISAVVIDSALGAVRGHELREFMRMSSQLPVIVIGDETELGTTQRLQLRGSLVFIPKPVHPRGLVEQVRMALIQGRN